MNASHILDALGTIDDKYIVEAKERGFINTTEKARSMKRTLALVAVIAALLTLCGFAAYQLGWFDPWLQKPSADPVQTVQSAIEGQAGKEYTVSVRVDEIKVDEDETARVAAMYSGSELARARGWTDEYLAKHFVVVYANYYVEYDHTKTFMDDGQTQQYFYLTQDTETGEWTISDNTSPDTSAASNVVWEYEPLLSSKLPAFPFKFDLPYSTIKAECDAGMFIGYQGHDGTAYPQGKQLSLPSGSTLYWMPQEEENCKYESSVEIRFNIYDEEEATFAGSISIQAETARSGSETVVYSALLNDGSGLSMAQATDIGGAVITVAFKPLEN
ncbi:hypothetical protein [Allofournierella sp.]|uniref:hypothetical protein n=1 Tax=Allofournierella sp. TaxID=1940256 RepID=UPI003AB4EB94